MDSINQKIEQLVRAIHEDAEPVSNWFELGGVMMSHQAWDALFNLFSDRESLFQDGLKLYSDLLMSHEAALSPHILSIYMNYEVSEIQTNYEAFLLYMSGACKISTGRVEEGREIFRRLARFVENDLSVGEGLPHLYGLDKFQKQIFTSSEISNLLVEKRVEETGNIEFYGDSTIENDAQLLFAACDQVYFEKFSKEFITVFQQFGPIHIHVINGDAERITQLLNIKNVLGISFSVEKYTGGIGSPYYACARFLQAEMIMERFNKDLIILDIDVAGQSDFKSFIHNSKYSDITLFKDITLVPWLKHRAVAIYVKNNENGHKYLNSFALILREALKTPAWFIDQSVLHCVNQYWDNEELR